MRGESGAKERLGAPLLRRRGASHHHERNLRPGHQKPRRRCAEPVGAINSLRVRLMSADRARDALRPENPDVRGGSRGSKARPLESPHAAGSALSLGGPPSGEQGSTPPVSPSREAVWGAVLNPMRPVPGSETEPPGFSAGNPGKPDTESIVSGPTDEMEGLQHPVAQSVYFSLHLAADRCRPPATSCRRSRVRTGRIRTRPG